MKQKEVLLRLKNYQETWQLLNGTSVTFRPIRPDDFELMIRFHEELSERSVYFRWFTPLGLNQRVAEERLKPACEVDFKNEVALVAEYRNPSNGEREIVGEGRLHRQPGTNEAEIAVIICDKYQRMGLGTQLMERLKQIGRTLKFERIIGDIHPENWNMQKVCRKLGFQVRYSYEEEVTKIAFQLAA